MTERRVRYIAPGHTQVRYAHRILDIKFKESDKSFRRKLKNRGARKSEPYKGCTAVKPKPKVAKPKAVKKVVKPTKPLKYTDTQEYKEARLTDEYRRMRNRSELDKGGYTKEDMRALLKDSHWEEHCGHSRWKSDDRSLVREFKKYLIYNRNMY